MPGNVFTNLKLQNLGRLGIDLEALRRVGPAIVAGDQPVGVPRGEVTVPVSLDGRVDDTVLFEDAADPGRRFYLPRYRLRVAETTGQYEITTELVDGQWRMTFGLESYPSDEVRATGVAAQVLPHELAVTVSSGSGLVRDYPVAELSRMVTDSQFRPEVVLLLTLQERDSLLRAFTRDEEQARIDVQRILTVAVPVAPPAPGPAVLETAGPDSLGTAVILPDLILANAVQAFPVPIRVVDPAPRPEELVVRPDVVLHQRLEVNPFDHVIGGGIFMPGGIPDVVIDPVPLPDPAPDPLPAPPEQRYTTASTTLVFPVPLRFDVDAHPYLFPSGRPAAGGGWATLVVPWPAEGPASRNHVYFHDEEAGNVFYHLPDAFLIGQRDQAPYGPELSFTVGRTTDPGTGTERAIALISAHLVPQSSPARLYDAVQRLAAHLPAGAGPVDLRQAVHPATCRLELPGSAVTTAAPPDLVHGWWIAETFDFDDLRDVYAVLTTDGAASALLRGRVDVDVMGQVHQVPVEVRLDRLALPPLSWTEKQTFDAQRSMRVELSNVGDVDVSVPSAAGWVDAGEGPVNAAVAGDLPAMLSPGATVTLTLTPDERPKGDEEPDATLDLTSARLVVDPEKAVQQTLDRRVARLPKVVTLLTTEGGLGTSGDPQKDLTLIALQFEGVSGAVTLDHTTLQRDVAVPVPLADLLLDRGSGQIRYRQTLVHVSGTSTADTEWRTFDANLLVLPVG